MVIGSTLNSLFCASCEFSTPSLPHSFATKDNVFSFTIKVEGI